MAIETAGETEHPKEGQRLYGFLWARIVGEMGIYTIFDSPDKVRPFKESRTEVCNIRWLYIHVVFYLVKRVTKDYKYSYLITIKVIFLK